MLLGYKVILIVCIISMDQYKHINRSIKQTNNIRSYILIHIHNYIYLSSYIYIYYLNNFHTLNTPSDDHTRHTQDKHIIYIHNYLYTSIILICFLIVLYEHVNIFKPPDKLPIYPHHNHIHI